MPRGFQPWPTPFGLAWRWAEVLPVGRVEGRTPPVAHAYLDTETTGLAGGTGADAFAAALARPVAAGLEVVQFFLPEPAAEPAFLHALQVELSQSPALGTYNGATFDLPLLRTRWVMARMPGDLEHPEHVDLLRLARALLRQRLESCTLRNVELALLGFEREEDLPGAMVPDAYFAYLRRGSSQLLEAALEHNRQDVVSLLYLHARLLMRLDGDDPWMEAPDWLALGRHLLREGRRADGWRALRNALAMGEGRASATAAMLIARRLVRAGRHPAAAAVLAGAQKAAAGEPALAIARARVLEWRLGHLATALEVVEAARAQGPHPALVELD
ncbi:MAG: ribonuclease H-like domain-containing protein, partial [Chloroflexota bacterium]